MRKLPKVFPPRNPVEFGIHHPYPSPACRPASCPAWRAVLPVLRTVFGAVDHFSRGDKQSTNSCCNMAMDQYLYIPFLGGWTSIYQLFWCELQGYRVLTHIHMLWLPRTSSQLMIDNPRLAEIQTYPHTLTYDVYANPRSIFWREPQTIMNYTGLYHTIPVQQFSHKQQLHTIHHNSTLFIEFRARCFCNYARSNLPTIISIVRWHNWKNQTKQVYDCMTTYA